MAGNLKQLLLAFAQYRWWSLKGHMRSKRRSDIFGRIQRWLEPLFRVLFWIMLVPTALSFAVLAAGVGWGLGAGKLAMEGPFVAVLRLALFGLTVMAIAGPLIIGTGNGRAELGRLLLLPISRAWLYGLRYLSTLTDPWHLATLVMVLFLPAGFAAGRWELEGASLASSVGATAVLGLAGGIFLLGNAALGFWIFLLVQRLLADRRRAEAAIFGGLIVVTLLGFGVLAIDEKHFSESMLATFFGLNPLGELVVTTLRGVIVGSWPVALSALAVSALALCGLLWLGQRAHDHLLLMGGKSASRGPSSMEKPPREPRIPGLGPAASMVAWVQIRTLWRTVPGKMALAQAPFMVLLAGIFIPEVFSFVRPEAGLGLAVTLLGIGVTFSLMSVQQFLFNTFAVDGAGATLQTLLPIGTRDLLLGKSAAWVLVVLGNFLISVPLALGLAWPGTIGALRGPLLALLATLSCLAIFVPAGLLCSALLPKQVDLGKAIQGNQPHAISIFGGVALLIVSWGLPILIVAIAAVWLGSLPWAFAILSIWLILCLAVGWALILLAESAYEGRREALLLEIQGR